MATMFAGCVREEPAEGTIIERATAPTPSLTSTTPKPAAPPEEPKEPVVGLDEEPPVDVASAPTAEPFKPDVETVDGLTLVRFVTTATVEGREPMPPASTFTNEDERVYAFIEAANESDEPKQLRVHFVGPDEEVSGGVALEIPASVPRWRTWAYTRHAKTLGFWRVEIRDEEGTLIGALPFEVEAAP
jgi:hypothetical protein